MVVVVCDTTAVVVVVVVVLVVCDTTAVVVVVVSVVVVVVLVVVVVVVSSSSSFRLILVHSHTSVRCLIFPHFLTYVQVQFCTHSIMSLYVLFFCHLPILDMLM